MKQTNKTIASQASKIAGNTPVPSTFDQYVSKVDDTKKANALKAAHAKAQTAKAGKAGTKKAETQTATKASVYAIVANVAFTIPRLLSGAFNTFHKSKGRLEWNGRTGKITAQGAQYFTQREGDTSEKAYKLFADQCSQAKYPLKEIEGIQWPVNASGVKWIPGQGSIGQSAFFYALCKLTQDAAKRK